MMKPVARRSRATGRLAVQMVHAALIFPDVDHPATDHSVTENTDPAVIERLPFPKGVRFLEHSQLFVEPDAPVHNTR